MWRRILLLVGMLLLTAGCCEFCNPDVHLGVSVAEPVFLRAPTTVQVMVSFSESQPRVTCGIRAEGPDYPYGSPNAELGLWYLGDVAKDESFRLPVTVTLQTPGLYTFYGSVHTGRGSYDATGVTLYLDESRYVVNPTPKPHGTVAQQSPVALPTTAPVPTGAGIR